MTIIYGLGILLLTPLVFHLTAFKKDTKFIQVLASVLVGEYILTTYLILFGLLHAFDWRLILSASLLTAIIVGRFIRDKNIVGTNSTNVPFFTIVAGMLFVLFVFIIQNYTFPANISLFADFSWARLIVREGSIPAFHLDNVYYAISKPPLLYTHVALLFSFQGNFEIGITRSISLFYTFLTMFLLMNWSREYGKHMPLFVLISLFGVWPLFIQFSSWSIEETPLLFFTTASFYLLFNYLKTRKDIYLVLLAVSLTLGILTDITSYLIFFLVSCALIMKSTKRGRIVLYLFLLSIPALLWISRNYYFYGSFSYSHGPVSSFIEGPMNMFTMKQASVSDFLSIVTKDFIAGFPASFLAFIHMYRNRREFEKKFIFLAFIFLAYAIIGYHKHHSFIRYMFPFFGVFALYSGIEMSRLYDLLPLKAARENKGIILVGLLIFLALFSFARIYMVYGQTEEYYGQKEILEYIIETGDENIRLFGPHDSLALMWYGDATIIGPGSTLFLILNEEKDFEYGKDSAYYHELFSKMDIDYVYDSPEYGGLDQVLDEIDKDEKHFELVYADEKGNRLWGVIQSNEI